MDLGDRTQYRPGYGTRVDHLWRGQRATDLSDSLVPAQLARKGIADPERRTIARSASPTPMAPPIASTKRLEERETQTRTFDLGVIHVESVVGREQSIDVFGVETRSGIAHGDAQSTAADDAADDDDAVLAVVLDGIGQEVDQHLLDASTVGQHLDVGRVAQHEFDSLRLGERRYVLDTRRARRSSASAAQSDRRESSASSRVNASASSVQLQQVKAGETNVIGEFHVLPESGFELEGLREAQDGVERRTHLVTLDSAR